MAVAAFDDTAAEVSINHPGELVCTRVFPIMPVSFWGKGGEEKYRASYFSKFPGNMASWRLCFFYTAWRDVDAWTE